MLDGLERETVMKAEFHALEEKREQRMIEREKREERERVLESGFFWMLL